MTDPNQFSTNQPYGEAPHPVGDWAILDESAATTPVVTQQEAYDAVMASLPHTNEFQATDLAELASQPDRNTQSVEILLNGTVDGTPITTDVYNIPFQREYFAEVAQHAPETLRTLAETQVAAFHGGRSATLGSMLEFGGKLQSSDRLKAQGDAGFLTMGGDAYTYGDQKDYVAFSVPTTRVMDTILDTYAHAQKSEKLTIEDLRDRQAQWQEVAATPQASSHNRDRAATFSAELDRAIDYASDHPDSPYTQLLLDDFPVVFGISREALFAGETGTLDPSHFYGPSELQEVHPESQSLALGDDLPVVAVPRDRMDKVQQLMQEQGYVAHVVPIEDLQPPKPQVQKVISLF